MSEFGIFTDEGCVESDFATFDAAEIVRVRDYADDDAYVAEVCHDHPEHERADCEECNADTDEDS